MIYAFQEFWVFFNHKSTSTISLKLCTSQSSPRRIWRKNTTHVSTLGYSRNTTHESPVLCRRQLFSLNWFFWDQSRCKDIFPNYIWKSIHHTFLHRQARAMDTLHAVQSLHSSSHSLHFCLANFFSLSFPNSDSSSPLKYFSVVFSTSNLNRVFFSILFIFSYTRSAHSNLWKSHELFSQLSFLFIKYFH